MSGHVRDVLTDPDSGLFPAPADVKPRCMCGDWTLPCKHVMAVLWGAGNHFDADPFLLFRLRGVHPTELIGNLAPDAAATSRPDVLAAEALAEIFGIVLEPGPQEPAFPYRRRTPVAGPRSRKTPAANRGPGNGASAEAPAANRNRDAAARRGSRAAARARSRSPDPADRRPRGAPPGRSWRASGRGPVSPWPSWPTCSGCRRRPCAAGRPRPARCACVRRNGRPCWCCTAEPARWSDAMLPPRLCRVIHYRLRRPRRRRPGATLPAARFGTARPVRPAPAAARRRA